MSCHVFHTALLLRFVFLLFSVSICVSLVNRSPVYLSLCFSLTLRSVLHVSPLCVPDPAVFAGSPCVSCAFGSTVVSPKWHVYFLTKISLLSFRQSGSGIHLRHYSGRGGPRHNGGVQPGQPEPVRLRPGEAGVLQPGGRLEVGRLLGRHQVWDRVLSPLRGCPRD